MANKWFLLDSLHADYAGVLSALATTTAGKYSDTVAQVVRDAEHDSDYKLVKANVTDDELVGSLAPLAKSLEGTGVYLESMDNITEHQRWAFNHVGDANPATGVVRKTYYLRSNFTQATAGGTVTTRTDGTAGRCFADGVFSQTVDGLVGLPASAYDIVVCDDLLNVAGASYSTTDRGFEIKQDCRVFYDKTGHRGCCFGAVLIGDGYSTWTDEGGDVYSIVTNTANPGGPSSSPRHFWARDKGDGDYGQLLTFASSQAEMEANEDYIWAASWGVGATVYVHMPAGVTPDRRIFMGTDNIGQGPMPRVSGTHPTGVKIWGEKWILNQRVDQTNYFDGPIYNRGQNNEYGMYRKGGMYGLRIEDGTTQITGPTIYGRYLAEFEIGAFYANFGDPTKGMTGAHFEDCETYDIGGVIPSHANSDGHADGVQNGPFTNATYRGKYHAIRCGAPVNFYSLETDNNPASSIQLGDDFSGLDWVTDDTLIQDHSTHWPSKGTSFQDVAFHFAGDSQAMANLNGNSVTMDGTISGFNVGIRLKHPYQVAFTSSTVGGLTIEKGNASGSDVTGISLKVSPSIQTVTLSSSSGNWAVGNNLEDPDNAGEAAGTITRVSGANPTVTLEYRITDGRGTPAFANTETVSNLDDTGTGTANGDSAALGSCGGNIDVSNIRFESDLDRFMHSDIPSAGPVSNANVPYTYGMHIQSDNNVFVGTTTGKFVTTKHGTQDFTGWKTNSVQDNVYDPNSTNPSS